MRKLKVLTELNKELSKIPSAAVDNQKLTDAFNRLKKELGITKDIAITDSLYLQPFKLEYIGVENGLKDYFIGLDAQRAERADEYCKLVIKQDKKLISIKSFGKVTNLSNDTLNMVLLLIRLSQYTIKNRELYSLEISMLQLLKS
jgi:hypothetical protein